jgi:hypothetical protein
VSIMAKRRRACKTAGKVWVRRHKAKSKKGKTYRVKSYCRKKARRTRK